MDPQQRLLLQTAWRALENATLDPRGQAGSNTGVFVGVMANEWAHLHMREYREITAQAGSGNGYFMTANRLSYQLDFKGPSLAVDTACSSSLVAVHLAVQALRNAECDQAVAAGVNLTLTPALNVFYTKAGLAAPDGRCKPFSGKADGIGRGEGVAVVVLRRLEDAVAAGLPIYAVIKGSAVNSDGRSNGITAPNRWAQQQVTATATQAAGIVSRTDHLPRGTWHRNPPWRHDRGESPCARPPFAPRHTLRDRVDQGQPRPHRGRSRYRRPDQGRAQPAPSSGTAIPLRRYGERTTSARRRRPSYAVRTDGIAAGNRSCRRLQLRYRWNKLPHGARQRPGDGTRVDGERRV